MQKFEFAIIAEGLDPEADDFEDRFFGAGCDDALISSRDRSFSTSRERIRTYDAPGPIGESTRVIGAYEDRVLGSTVLQGVVLRYGFFYGPGTWYRPDGAIAEQVRKGEARIIGDGAAVWSFVHIDDAVAATVAAITAEPGTYNVVDDDPLPVSEWLPAFARWIDAPVPPRMSVADALAVAGEEVVYYHTNLTGGVQRPSQGEAWFHAASATLSEQRALIERTNRKSATGPGHRSCRLTNAM